MKTVLMLSLSLGFLLTTASQAQEFNSSLQFECKQRNGDAVLEGKIFNQKIQIKISDSVVTSGFTQLGIYSYTVDLSKEWAFEKLLDRKNEKKYSYRNYFNDNSPTQNFTLAMPKSVVDSNIHNDFVAYFTVANDNGDMMVPSASEALDCFFKN